MPDKIKPLSLKLLDNLDKLEMSADLLEQITAPPVDNRRAAPGYHLHRPMVSVQYRLPIPLYAWIEDVILAKSGWGWRHFSEAAVLAALSPQWVHPTWHVNFVLRGRRGGTADSSRMWNFTPFQDLIPDNRGANKNLDPNNWDAHYLLYPSHLEGRTPKTKDYGLVNFAWHGHQHWFCDQLTRITPPYTYTERAKRVGEFQMSVSDLVRQCVVAHFSAGGIAAAREAIFQLWREYVGIRLGVSPSPLPTVDGIMRYMIERRICNSNHSNVRLWDAIVEPFQQHQQFQCQFWHPSVVKQFMPLNL
jgi:hypothetical protein